MEACMYEQVQMETVDFFHISGKICAMDFYVALICTTLKKKENMHY